MIALICGVAWAGVSLPDRTARPTDLELGECIETGVEAGLPVPSLPDCTGIVLPLSQWQWLESQAVYAGQVGRLWALREEQYRIELEWLEYQLEVERQPIPFFSRPSTHALIGGVVTGALLVGYHWATSPR